MVGAHAVGWAAAAVLVGSAALAAAAIPAGSTTAAPSGPTTAAPAASTAAASAPVTPGDALVRRGAYLAAAGDCLACHTQPGGRPFAGGLSISTPYGSLPSPNITPDKATGIGAWTDDEFYRAMHDGIGRHGKYLYPVMPFPWYTNVTREDVLAIKAYLFAQPAVSQAPLPNRLSFPYRIRESLLAWRTLFFKPGTFKPDPNQTDEVNRGAYLVNGLAHCGECHNGRAVAGASKWRQSLQGGVVDGWYAPNITSDVRSGIGAWTNDEIARYLKTGSAPGKGIALGPMAETVHSLSQLDDADLKAIAAYLKTTPPKSDAEQKLPLYAGQGARGADAYLSYCASCHGVDGAGIDGVVPRLAGNGAVIAKGPQNVMRAVLGGVEAHQGYAPMLAIGAAMSDADVADVANYVRQTWGNAAPPTALPGMVASLRKSTDTVMTGARSGTCPAIAAPALAKAVADPRSGVAERLGAMNESTMPAVAEQVVATLRRAAPRTAKADFVNGLAAAYCGVVRRDASLDWNQRALRIGHFSQLVYSAATGNALR